MVRRNSEQSIIATTTRAIELTEEALAQVAQVAVEGIHCGLEASAHVEAAERGMRDALRQLVLAERELRSRAGLVTGLDQLPDGNGAVVHAPGADAAAGGA